MAKITLTTGLWSSLVSNINSMFTELYTASAINSGKTTNATHTGDATGSQTLTLATVNSNVGSFTNANITVNAKGLVTAASNGTGGTGDTMVYPGSGIPLSTGTSWGTSIANNSTNWNTAYGWGNHASAGYATTSSLSGYVPTTRTVNSRALSGNIVITASDLSLGNVTNTSDANKPVSTAQQTALNLKANIASPSFTTGITTPAITIGSTALTASAEELNILHNLDPNLIYIGDIAVLRAEIDAALTDNTPTDSELDAATGKTPATAGKGYKVTIKDTSGTGALYFVESDGTDWYYIKFTKAV